MILKEKTEIPLILEADDLDPYKILTFGTRFVTNRSLSQSYTKVDRALKIANIQKFQIFLMMPIASEGEKLTFETEIISTDR